jgi:hypothetical protein
MIIPYLVFGILVLMMIFLLFGRAQEVEIPHLLSDQEILQLAQQGKKIEAIKCWWCSESVETSLNETPKFKAIDK